MSRRSVLVTGAYGLIGSWLVKALLEADAEVTVIRRDETVRSPLQLMGLGGRVNVVAGDICSAQLVERALVEHEIGSVFHLAAQTIVPTAHRSPVSTFETNIRGTWTLLEACRRNNVEHVVVASSDKAYGRHQQLPYGEEHSLAPLHPYEVSKAAADMLARTYWHTWRLPVAVTRFANVYGGGDTNGSRLVPEAVSAALAGRPPILRSDGSPERDFLYVEDAVRAYLAIWSGLENGHGHGEAFNAGGGRPYRVLDVVTLICNLIDSGVQPEVRGEGTPAGEIDRQWVDSTKLRRMTGWEPRASLEDGLRRTIEWYRTYA